MAFSWQLPDGRWRVRVSAGSGKKRKQITGTVETEADIAAIIPKLAARAGRKMERDRRGYVYFLRNADGFIKIGFSGDPLARMKEYRQAAKHTGGSVQLVLVAPGTRHDESRMHARYADYRLEGERELFMETGTLKKFLRTVLD